jgi:hypothetical protein
MDSAEIRKRLEETEKARGTLEEIFIPLEHASGPRMGKELLKRLSVARKRAGDNAELVSQIDTIIASLKLGDDLCKKGVMGCW